MAEDPTTKPIEVTYGSYRLSEGTFKPVDSEEPYVCLALEIIEINEAVLFLTKTEAQQLITNLYKQMNELD